jgi:hypothetical protein
VLTFPVNSHSLSTLIIDMEEMSTRQQQEAAVVALEQVAAAAQASCSTTRQDLVHSRVTRLLADAQNLDASAKVFQET